MVLERLGMQCTAQPCSLAAVSNVNECEDVNVNLNGHSTAVGHLIHVKLQPSPKQGTAPSWHLYPGGDSGVRSSWVECLEVMTWDFSGDSRLLK